MSVISAFRTLPPVMRGLTCAYVGSGVLHLVRPQTFEAIMPRELPAHRALVRASGVTELACAFGLVDVRTRRFAALGSAAMLTAFVPAHVEMTRQAYERIQRKGSTPGRQAYLAGTVARILGQAPLIAQSIQLSRR